MKIGLLRFLALLASTACISLVGTIEFLNFHAGDAIARKQRQEPHSKWRTGSLFLERKVADAKLRSHWNLPPDQPLTAAQSAELEKLALDRWEKSKPHDRLTRVMKTCSAWGLPLGIITMVLGRWAWGGKNRLLHAGCSAVGMVTLLIAALRYIPSLGW